MPDPEPLWRVRDVARRLRLSPRTVRRYIARGWLEAARLPGTHWRIRSASLAALEGRQGHSGAALPRDEHVTD